jgi:hypothetical protein
MRVSNKISKWPEFGQREINIYLQRHPRKTFKEAKRMRLANFNESAE